MCPIPAQLLRGCGTFRQVTETFWGEIEQAPDAGTPGSVWGEVQDCNKPANSESAPYVGLPRPLADAGTQECDAQAGEADLPWRGYTPYRGVWVSAMKSWMPSPTLGKAHPPTAQSAHRTGAPVSASLTNEEAARFHQKCKESSR